MSGFGAFGSSAASGTQTTSAPSLFGGPSPFGSTQPQQPLSNTGAFGSAPAATGAFGATNNTSAPQTNIFGQPVQQSNNTQLAAPSNSFAAFGSSTTTNNASTTPAAPTAGTGLFGSFGQNNNTTTTTPSSGSSLFGAFGQSTTAGASNPAGQAPTMQGGGTGLFGAFGQPSQANAQATQPQPSAFGSSLLSGSMLGGPSLTSGFGAPNNAFASSSLAPAPPAQNVNPQMTEMQRIRNMVYTNSPDCRFQHYFYNVVEADQVQLYQRPAGANEELWQRAVRDNPNPERLVPVLAVGYGDLLKRENAQKEQGLQQVAALNAIKRDLTALSEARTLTLSPKLVTLVRAQITLVQRLQTFIHHLHLLTSLRSSSITQEEEQLRANLEAIEAELRRPGGLGRVGGRVGELWGVVGRVRAQKESGAGANGLDTVGGWAVVDPSAFEEIKQILVNEQQGLKYLTELLRKAQKDVELIASGQLGRLDVTR